MAPIKFLLALSSLAIFSCSLGPTSVNAMSIDSHVVNRRTAHDSLAKRRCKQRSPAESSPAPPASTASPSSSSTPTSTPTPTTTPITTTSSGTKLGLAWALPEDGLKLLVGKAKFVYNWSPSPAASAKQLGLTPVPQLWGYKSVDDFVKYVVEGYASYALGMNEPNEIYQANLSPAEGVAMWRQYMQPLKAKGYQLGSAATSSNPNGMVWMKEFLAECPDCTWDFTCIHWYDIKFDDFVTYVNTWHDAFGKDIWITEFALHNFNSDAQPTDGEIWDFHVKVAQWVKTVDWIIMAAPFAFVNNAATNLWPTNNFVAQDGSAFTDLGNAVIAIYNS